MRPTDVDNGLHAPAGRTLRGIAPVVFAGVRCCALTVRKKVTSKCSDDPADQIVGE